MRPMEFRLYSWLIKRSQEARFNLASSGLTEPDLPKMGIDTSYEHFASIHVNHEQMMKEPIAELYGVDTENIVLTSGASEAIFITFAAFGGGKTALVPLPNYEPIFVVPRSLGMRVGHSLGAPPRPDLMYALTDPNNPTGLCLDGDEEEMLIEAAGKGATVFVNETYKEFTFQRRPRSLFQKDENLIVCSSMTKFFGLGWLRIGWLIADRKKAGKMTQVMRLLSGHNSEYSLYIARQVLAKRGEFVKRARETYVDNLALVKQFAKMADGVRVKLPDAAPFCLVQYKGRESSIRLASELLRRKGVLVSPGDYFGAPRSFRMCFTLDGPLLARGLGQVSDFMAK
jgi:aspartate/methionine/tyrosine aminotransferase